MSQSDPFLSAKEKREFFKIKTHRSQNFMGVRNV